MEVAIGDFNGDGRGRARSGGRAVLVAQAYPGERVLLREDRRSKGAIEGRVGRLLDSPPGVRIAHGCVHEFQCTGCPLLALDAGFEAEWKSARVREILGRLGCADVPFEYVRPGPLFAYRRFGKAVFARLAGRVRWGSYVQSTHEFADNAGCPVLHPSVSAILDACAEEADALAVPVDGAASPGLKHGTARTSAATGQALMTLTSTGGDAALPALCRRLMERLPSLTGIACIRGSPGDNVLLRGECFHVEGDPEIREELLGFSHRIGPRAFFQVNPQAAERLFEAAVALVPEGAAALEGYAGVGALTLPLLRRSGRVHAIEANPDSHRILAARAASGLTVERAAVEAVLAERLAGGGFSACVMDPPRRGLGAGTASILAERGPGVVVALHCSLASFERDAAALLAGGYRLADVLAVDQFPRTAHGETLSRFLRDPEAGR